MPDPSPIALCACGHTGAAHLNVNPWGPTEPRFDGPCGFTSLGGCDCEGFRPPSDVPADANGDGHR
jgi:hypothetical protein